VRSNLESLDRPKVPITNHFQVPAGHVHCQLGIKDRDRGTYARQPAVGWKVCFSFWVPC
jgi:hypothetical protein